MGPSLAFGSHLKQEAPKHILMAGREWKKEQGYQVSVIPVYYFLRY